MAETTEELAYRLRTSIEAHPMAPPTPYGVISWLKRELEKEGLEVSVNTVHKWYHGASRPRPDNIRILAKVLKVDELWLAMGKKPDLAMTKSEPGAISASAANLLLAGIIEAEGGKATFITNGDAALSVNIQGEAREVVAVLGQKSEDSKDVSFIVPEPTKGRDVIGLVQADPGKYTVAFNLTNLTNTPRENFGGFSVVKIAKADVVPISKMQNFAA